MAVNLFFETLRDSEIEKNIKNYDIIRVKAVIQFKLKDGWSKPYPAIVDTGAHTSVIPPSIWKRILYEKVGEYKMFGISKKEECAIPVDVGEISCILVDESGNQTKELGAFAFLATTDNVPLILGFKGVLERFNFVCNFSENLVYVEE